MNDQELQETLSARWKELPENVRALILSPDFKKTIGDIGTQYSLSADQQDALYQETFFVVFGIIHLMDFTDNVEREVAVSKEQARTLAREVGNRLFVTIKDYLKERGDELEASKKESAPEDGPAQSADEAIAGVQIEPTIEAPSTQEETSTIDREKLLKEIEQPSTIAPTPQNTSRTTIDSKLSTVVKIPTESVHVDMNKPTNSYKGQDPYREPLE